MESKNEFLDEKKESNLEIDHSKINIEKDSIQYNRQDLDQEQKVDVNPMQLNTQNFFVQIRNDNNYSGKITGITFLEKSKEIAQNVNITLFWGLECKHPVYKTNSDNNGNFIIEDLPSGYYTLSAELKTHLRYRSEFIKVLPCQNVQYLIYLNSRDI